MRRTHWSVILFLGTALVGAGCGSDSDEVLGPTGDVDAQVVASTTERLILPVFDVLTFILSLDDGAVLESASRVVPPCDPWPVCLGGSAEICFGEQTGEYDLSFFECSTEGGVFDGAVSLDPNVGGVIVGLELDVNGSAVLGNVMMIVTSETCVNLVFEGLATSFQQLSSSMSGTLAACQNYDWPDGSLLVLTFFEEAGDLRWQYYFDGTQIVDVLVYSGDGNVLLNSCEYDVELATASCDA